jgi:hypothetical protein
MGARCSQPSTLVEEPIPVSQNIPPHFDKISTVHPNEKLTSVQHMLVCYICGQKYGPSSLPIHQEQCPEKRKAILKDIPKSLQPPTPEPPSLPMPHEHSTAKEITLYNEQAEKISMDAMCHCPHKNCNRRFEPDRLMVHLKSCKDDKGNLWEEKEEKKHIVSGQHMIICYMCGQKYGPTSLPFHQKQCPAKREANLKTIPEELRPDEPVPPELPLPGEHSTADQVSAYNEQAYESFRNAMSTCPHANCSRRFEPDRLMVHLRSCKDQNGELWSEEKHPTYKALHTIPKANSHDHMVCYVCGQKYSTASLPIHLKQCPDKSKACMKEVPKEIRPPMPSPPESHVPTDSSSQSEFETYNAAAQKIYEDSMCHCPHKNCNRRFEPDRLMVHLRSCKDEHGELWSADQHNTKPSKRRLLVCYSCGQEYGTSSLSIHLRECPEKRAREHASVPEQCRGEELKEPSLPLPGEKASIDDIEAYNAEARENYTLSMARCSGCDRKFEPGPLEVHLRGCSKLK